MDYEKDVRKELEIQRLFQRKGTAALRRENRRSAATRSRASLEQHHVAGEILQGQGAEDLRPRHSAEHQSPVLSGGKLRFLGQQSDYRNAYGRVDRAQASVNFHRGLFSLDLTRRTNSISPRYILLWESN